MKPLPLPVRIAAGLAVTAVEQARDLPGKLTGLPVTVVSQALQLSMRVQQQVTELAIKGDDVLATLRPVEDEPAWAIFDEDTLGDTYDASRPRSTAATNTAENTAATENMHSTDRHEHSGFSESSDNSERSVNELASAVREAGKDSGTDDGEPDPWTLEERALAAEHEDGEGDTAGPGGLPNYDELSLPQLRARLRKLDVSQLEDLLAHERAHADRPSFVGMLSRRIATVHAQQ